MTMRPSGSPACSDGVAHGALVAFDVQLDAGGEAVFGAVEVVAGADDAVARDGQEGAAQGVEVGGGGRVGMGRGALRRRCCSCAPEGAADALRVPGLPGGAAAS